MTQRIQSDSHADDRARDDLVFDPIPPAPWLVVGEKTIEIRTAYSERLSKLLGRIDGARWDAGRTCWTYPLRAGPEIRRRYLEIDELQQAASEKAEMETARRRAAAQAAREQRRAEVLERLAEQERRRMARHPAALRSEYLATNPGRPDYPLTLEAIGDDQREYGMPRRDSVEMIFGRDCRGRFIGAYLGGLRDYCQANSVGSRGIKVTYNLEEGPIYRVKAPRSWKETEVYFVRIADGQRIRMSTEEVTACLVR